VGRHKSKPADAETIVLGERIRQLRNAKGLTLKELGAKAGLSHAFLSQLERGLARPSLSTLTSIATALSISTSVLVTHTSSGVARFVRGEEAPTVSTGPSAGTVSVRALTSRDSLMKVTESAGRFSRTERMAHPGEEVVYVIEGRLEIEVGGERFMLGSGDVLSFDSSLEHTYKSVGNAAVRFLLIAADPGQYASPIDESVYDYRLAKKADGADTDGGLA